MARVLVYGADIEGDQVQRMRVKMHNLPARTIERDVAIGWMRDQHSFLAVVRGGLPVALQLVEVGEDDERFIRTDASAEAADVLPELPSVQAAGV